MRSICFGVTIDDLVTAVEFDDTGKYLAVGDKAGRICIFEGLEDPKVYRWQ